MKWEKFMFQQAHNGELQNLPEEIKVNLSGDSLEGEKAWFSLLG